MLRAAQRLTGRLRPGSHRRGPSPAALHRAARAEDAVQRFVSRPLRRRGWRPGLIAYTGYGGPGWVRVLARVLLTPPGGWRDGTDAARGWRNFLTLPVEGVEVEVDVAGATHRAASDRSGYIDAVLPVDLPAGWHHATVRIVGATGTGAAVADLRMVAADADIGIVSDIDDTVMVTALPRPLIAFWNTFVLHEHARRPVPGMAELYRELVAAHPDAPVLYLSTGAWNVAPTLGRFLDRHGFPPGPMLLTDWGPTAQAWFRDGPSHKRSTLARLARELPQVRWILVGDDGQHDPELYGEFTREATGRVRAVAVRHLSPTQQVLARGLLPTEPDRHDPSVPWLVAPDGWELADQLRERGLLPEPVRRP